MSRATQSESGRNKPSHDVDRRPILPSLMPELGVFLALFALAALSVLVAFWSALGGLAILACLAIAFVMAALVMTFFMHLRSAMSVMMLVVYPVYFLVPVGVRIGGL